MNIPTPKQQRWLAERLPNKLSGDYKIFWYENTPEGKTLTRPVLETEWAEIVLQVESQLNPVQRMVYAEMLCNKVRDQETVQPYYEIVGLVAQLDPATRTTALMEVLK